MSKKNIAERKLSFNTRAVHVGQEQADPASGARAVPIYQSTAFENEASAQLLRPMFLSEKPNCFLAKNVSQGDLTV